MAFQFQSRSTIDPEPPPAAVGVSFRLLRFDRESVPKNIVAPKMRSNAANEPSVFLSALVHPEGLHISAAVLNRMVTV
jgi:hypothetical protein